jgi:hypothetical protein
MPHYSARPDGKATLDEILRLIPEGERIKIEDAFNDLFNTQGYGQVTFVVVNGKLKNWRLEVSRKL